jgi:hypothetical protein
MVMRYTGVSVTLARSASKEIAAPALMWASDRISSLVLRAGKPQNLGGLRASVKNVLHP